ncbi:MAG TPA: acyltransferase [Chloroflexota bacterium]|nr:acyltransferase [Chloroflexota bacterium]
MSTDARLLEPAEVAEPPEAYAELGEGCTIQQPVVLGLRYRAGCQPLRCGRGCVIRAFTTIYADVQLGDEVVTGHNVLIREFTRAGSQVTIGSGTIIDGHVEIGSFVKLESRVYVPTHARLGSRVFVGPGAILTNDKYPLRRRDEYECRGPVIEDDVTIGANATILPGVHIGQGAMVAAGCVVTHDVPAWHLAAGCPGRVSALPDRLREPNRALTW